MPHLPLVRTVPRLLALPRSAYRRVREWPVAAQQHARRNAMVAATACAERRRDREDVARFLAERAQASAATVPTAAVAAGARRRPAAHG